ncbi:antitoxin [Mycolicibacterium chitae]|uniref:DNA-binding protein, CopG family n=1 Tax=Mycolicibacterium chitae TaxID=1792 RepID=A0A448IBJ4_MYCCI|nr:antitoxin [Mycolicibacterium chitae]MCV7109242.1 antitoxin [Mycolicibacterium chitae]BBZ00976.1 antitoxin [Mycolicibacterium chitae]VEG49823.1 DNA-binding protein, CopG family [Mycolicibacterium chitae]
MATATTTIRVPVTVRDRLAAQARERGVSVASLLEEWSARAEREAAFAAERAATLAEADDPNVADEERDWAQADADGLD